VTLSLLAVTAGTAYATDEPPTFQPGALAPGAGPVSIVPLQPAPPVAAVKGALTACKDASRPTSGFGAASARRAVKTRVLSGRATDSGCGVAMVTVSIARKSGKRCQYLTSARRLTRPGRCTGGHWLMASGRTTWRVTIPRSLPKGTYIVRTRAFDFAGNAQKVRTGKRARALRLR
jgi:hypothetical protein